MNVQRSNDLYVAFLRNPRDELISKLIELLLKGDMITYLNLYNYISTDLPIVSLKYKSSIYTKIMYKIMLASRTSSNAYATAFSTKISLFIYKTTAEFENAKRIFLQIGERDQPIGYVELGILELLSQDEADSRRAIHYFEKALSFDKRFAYAHLMLGDYYKSIAKDHDQALEHYKIAAKSQLPGVDSKIAQHYVYRFDFKEVYAYLRKPSDDFTVTKHLTFGLYLEMKAAVNENYISAFKHYLIAYILEKCTANHVLQNYLYYFLNAESELLSKCFNSIFEKFTEIIIQYENSTQTKPLFAEEIFEKLANESHVLKNFDIGNLINKPKIVTLYHSEMNRRAEVEKVTSKLAQIQNVLINNIISVHGFMNTTIRETAKMNVLEKLGKNETKKTESGEQ